MASSDDLSSDWGRGSVTGEDGEDVEDREEGELQFQLPSNPDRPSAIAARLGLR